MLVPNLQLGPRMLGPTSDPVANRALYQRYAKRLQAQLGIGFQVYVDDSDGYTLLQADDDQATTCWLTAAAVYAALTPEIIMKHRLMALSDETVLLKATAKIEQALKTPK
ncbi:hypothetical protein RA086_07015 [Lactiplantibacillus sp. WILCCON 0030]|uniref:Uncharacterized protein n=1 Tax=Lactiplantibacillus brownii TaxID=3069269 RepID=A0ABU1A8X7_9LACO|nr:hypothetical protein [Lactiplantibacillus brownii]MDQ7937376.1 hypothetical protein [Lactiplantibacillus brownii]